MSSKSRRVLAYIALALICYLASGALGKGPASLAFFLFGGALELCLWVQAWKALSSPPGSRSRDS